MIDYTQLSTYVPQKLAVVVLKCFVYFAMLFNKEFTQLFISPQGRGQGIIVLAFFSVS